MGILRSFVGPIRHADRRVRPDIVAGEEGVGSENGSRLKVELVLDSGASVPSLGSVGRLASRCRGRRRPRAAAVPRTVAGAITADELIGRKISALGSCEKREAPVGKDVDGSIMEGSIGRPLESLMGEREMAAGIGLIGEAIVEVD